MISFRSAVIFILSLFSSANSFSQNFGGNPGNIKWRQINTDAVKIIFPKGMDSVAGCIATVTELLNRKYAGTIGTHHRKVSIVLQADNTLSNAYVGLAPWRSEFYLTTPQNPFQNGSLNWVDNLSVHEFRHVEQYSNFNVGLSKFFSILLGEQGQTFANSVAIPGWFFEGDAVWNETAFSRQGRGRLPYFFNAYKSLYYDNKHYSFMKLRNGSFKNFVPNHYDLGYLLVAYGREKYGDSIWRNVTQDAARFKGLFYPLQKAVKRNTGINYTTFTKDALAYYHNQWKNENTGEVQWLTVAEKNNVVNYKYAYPVEDGGMVALKNSYKQNPRFVKLYADGKEERIAARDIGYDDYFGYKNGRIIYAAWQPDIRWDNRDYSVIRILEISSKKITDVTTKTKYFSPDISADGQTIIAVEADPEKTCVLHLLRDNGQIIKTWTADSSLFYSHPKFLKDEKKIIVAARQPNGYMGWLEWNTENNEHRWLLEPANRIIGFPVVLGDTLFYSGTAGSSDGLYALDLSKSSEPVLLAVYKTGIYQGFAKDGKIIGSAFTADGFRLGVFNFSDPSLSLWGLPLNSRNDNEKDDLLQDLYTPHALAGKENVTEAAAKQYTISKYRKGYKLLNFHSWQGEISDPDYTVSILGENVLNTLQTKLYYTYNRNESSNTAGFTGVYGGWYVQPVVDESYTWGRRVALNADTNLLYNENVAAIGLQLPLNLSFGKAYRFLNLYTGFNAQKVRWTGYAKDHYKDLDFNYLTTRLTYNVQLQKALKQIYPRYAESFLAEYRTIVNKYAAWQFLLNGSLYLPGLFASHSLVLTGAYQARDTMQQYIFSSSFPFSRGYDAYNFPRMFRLGANYHFPLWYPDWGFGNMVYFQRIRANAFYDYTQGKSVRTGNTFPFSTIGGEFYLDTRVWNQLPITVGIRYSHLLDTEFTGGLQPNQWEIILPVNLLPR